MKRTVLLILICISIASCNKSTYECGNFYLGIDNTGYLSSVRFDGTEYISGDDPSPLVQLYDGNQYISPVKFAKMDGDTASVVFENGSTALLSINTKDDYIRLELLSLSDRTGIKDFVWGPYGTTISKWIGETICTVRDKNFAFGVWGLNPVTVEGLPDPENIGGGMFIEPLDGQMIPAQLVDSIGKPYPHFNVSGDLPEYVRIYRGAGARRTENGSQVRLHAHDHRIVDTVNFAGSLVVTEPIEVDFIGSAVAIFGCQNDSVLQTIEKIELGEGLPHPEINGVWIKQNQKASDAYLMYEGSDFDKILDYADSCGFDRIHIGDIFASWGKFPLKTSRFPGGAPDIKAFTDKAKSRGITIGAHSLTMFTTVNDGYVTPRANHNLCAHGKAILVKDITAGDTQLTISDTKMFENPIRTKSIRIGDEIMSYESASDGIVKGLKRGQFGTVISSHSAGDTVAHLKNNCYNGLYPDIYIEKEFSDRLAEIVKETGIGLLDFDGFDGGHNGHGQYEMAEFAKNWYDSLGFGIYNCGSRTSQYYWHVYSYMNWGEPWYTDLRNSMPNYREENQRYFERNLMPGMLGWYSMGPEFRPEDVEWINAKSIGLSAGYLIHIDDKLDKAGFLSEYFAAFRNWQDARRNGIFTDEQKKALKDVHKDFHLEPYGNEGWLLNEIVLQKGFAQGKSEFENTFLRQPASFYGYIEENIPSLSIEINGKKIEIPGSLQKGDRIYSDGLELHVCDSYWNIKRSIMTKNIMWVEGKNEIIIDTPGKTTGIRFEMKSSGKPENIKRK